MTTDISTTVSGIEVTRPNSTGHKKRIASLDVARVIAIAIVVFVHSVEMIYGFRDLIPEHTAPLDYSIMHYIGRLGVPLFLFITGALILRKPMDTTSDVFKFYKHNLIPLLVTSEIWIVISNIFLYFFYHQAGAEACFANGDPFDFGELLRQMLFVDLVNLKQWWYIPMIIGIYVVMPFLSFVVRNFPPKAMSVLIIISICAFFALPTYNLYAGYWGWYVVPSFYLETRFYGGAYGTFVILGYYLQQGMFKKVNVWIWVAVLIGSAVMGTMAATDGFRIWYDNFWILLSSIALMEIIFRIDRIHFKEKPGVPMRMVSWVSRTTFGIFLIHTMLMYPLYTPVKAITDPVLATFALFALTFLASIGVTSVLAAIKPARRALLDMK
ncbi:MAG: acyltransferase [Coriobacteriales bacterium]|jgi:surface polysaccharide O-acyltransferase-like enzyme